MIQDVGGDGTAYVQPCVSLAVQGRVLGQQELVLPDNSPDVVIMRTPWRIRLRVDRVVLGDLTGAEVEVTGVQHTGLNEDYGRTFLLGGEPGRYRLLAVSPRSIRSHRDLEAAARGAGAELCEPVSAS
ncbi:MAG: hypothetical protein EBR82_02130 [Caulobacteraceae bacterium]|nr:hypothetical protein [Caulobacteraceae bacterium]